MPMQTQDADETRAPEHPVGDEMDCLVDDFDHLHKEYNDRILEIQSLKKKHSIEVERREALEVTCAGLKKDKECLMKTHMETLNKLTEQLEYHTKYQSALDQANMVKEKFLTKEKEHQTTLESLQIKHQEEILEMQKKIRTTAECFQEKHQEEIGKLQKQIRYNETQLFVKEEIISQLQMELADCEARTDTLSDRLDIVEQNAESKYEHDMQELRDKLQLELEAKNKLHGELKNVEQALLINKMKYEEQLRDSSSNRHIDMFKQKLMKLRKENEGLRRQLLSTQQ